MKRQKNIENQQFVIFFFVGNLYYSHYFHAMSVHSYVYIIFFCGLHRMIGLYRYRIRALCIFWTLCSRSNDVILSTLSRKFISLPNWFKISFAHTIAVLFNFQFRYELWDQSISWLSIITFCPLRRVFFKYDQCFSYSTKCLWVLTTFALFFLTIAI